MTQKPTAEILQNIFKNNFEKIMINKDFNQFKKDYPTLYTTVLCSLMDASIHSMDYAMQPIKDIEESLKDA